MTSADKLIATLNGTEKYERYKKLVAALSFGYFRHIDEIDKELLDYKDENGLTLLMHAVNASAQNDGIKLLLLNGADPNIKNNNGQTALIMAVQCGNDEAVKELIACRTTDLNAQTNYKFTALMLAAVKHSLMSSIALLAAGADRTLQNYRGDDVLVLALLYGSHHVVNHLVSGNLDQVGYTDLMIDIYKGDYFGAKQKISSLKFGDRRLNAANNGGYSALMLAAALYSNVVDPQSQQELFDIILLLMLRGANVGLNNKRLDNFFKICQKNSIFSSDERLEAMVKICDMQAYSDLHNGEKFLHHALKCGLSFQLILQAIQKTDVNSLDFSGNAPLSNILFDTEKYYQATEVMNLVQLYGAKFIRNNTEVKSALHIKAICAPDTWLNESQLSDEDIAKLNHGDENGRTALHYACMLKKFTLAERLVAFGGKLTIADKFGKTPTHYAAINGHCCEWMTAGDLEIEDDFGVTPAIFLCQHANSIDTIDAAFTSLYNRKASQHLLVLYENPLLNHTQKLAIISALKNYYKLLNSENAEQDLIRFDSIAEEIINKQVAKAPSIDFASNFAIGLELEVPELPMASFIPTADLSRWFHADLVVDATVKKSILSLDNTNHEQSKEPLEFVSKVIANKDHYHKFMLLCKSLFKSGAKVNGTAGMHIHINCRGTNVTQPQVLPFVESTSELVFLKYVILNYISIEQLLRGFMRDAVLFDEHGSSYVEPLSKYRDLIMSCASVKELQRICTHNKTLDLTALNKHGTIEFRIHEGMIDPLLLNAWIDCITRLIYISYNQFIAHLPEQDIEPKENIEHLVYLLIAMRKYNQTWSSFWAGTTTANISTTTPYSTKIPIPFQVQIQQSHLYNLANEILNSSEYDLLENLQEYLKSNPIDDQTLKCTLIDLKQLISFAVDNPGPFSPILNWHHIQRILQQLAPATLATQQSLFFSLDNTGVDRASNESNLERPTKLMRTGSH